MMSTMKQIEDLLAVDAPVGSEGGRSPSALSTGQAPTTPAMVLGATATPATAPPKVGPLAPGQRWSVARKREVVMRLLRGESVELLSRELGVPIFKLEQWRQKADAALDGALKEREAETASTELAAAMQRIGELSMEVELLRARMDRPGPLARRRSR
jgi:transposase